MPENQICITESASAAPSVKSDSSNKGLCHFCFQSNSVTMYDLETGKTKTIEHQRLCRRILKAQGIAHKDVPHLGRKN